jgi:hypothetical protein
MNYDEEEVLSDSGFDPKESSDDESFLDDGQIDEKEDFRFDEEEPEVEGI